MLEGKYYIINRIHRRLKISCHTRGSRGHDLMVNGFTTTYEINIYHH